MATIAVRRSAGLVWVKGDGTRIVESAPKSERSLDDLDIMPLT